MKKPSILPAKRQVLVSRSVKYLESHNFPGSGGKSWLTVVSMFWEGMQNSILAMRASALSFKFIMAAIPVMVLLVALLPYLFPGNTTQVLMQMLENFLPSHVFASIEDPLIDVLSKPRRGLLSVVVLVALYFSVNGTRAIMVIFNESHHIKENRPLLKQFFVALQMMIVFAIIAAVSLGLFLLNKDIVQFLSTKEYISIDSVHWLFVIAKWLIFFFLLSITLSVLYYMAPAKRIKFHLFSPGSIIASFFSLIITFGFDFFISNFSNFNRIYGSISALFVLMIWLFYNAMVFLIGFEINMAVYMSNSGDSEGSNA